MLFVTIIQLTSILAIVNSEASTNVTLGECQPPNMTCTNCYSALKESLQKRDDNVRKLSETFFPPSANQPEFVEVTYTFGENSNNKQVWFWTHDSSYLFFPLETFQYLSLFFGKPALFFSQKVSLNLDEGCSGANHEIMRLLTQRVSYKYYYIYNSYILDPLRLAAVTVTLLHAHNHAPELHACACK